ncbi:MAG: hypothetical protein NXH85_04835 [Pseudomonadaceae bacterium]|nr:hypothetical protein [Pseudomonadaceae bacterium]
MALDAQLLAARAEQRMSRGSAAQAAAQSTVVEEKVELAPQTTEPTEQHNQHEQRAADDLTRIRGVGPKLAALLQSLGIVRFAQIAAFDAADLERLDDKLGAFKGRAVRDDWVGQAATLAESD